MPITYQDLTLLAFCDYTPTLPHATVNSLDYEDFGSYPNTIPGLDRHITLTHSVLDHPDTPWSATLSDRDDDGDVYTEVSRSFPTLPQAITWAHEYPWTPPLTRITALVTAIERQRELELPVHPAHRDALRRALGTHLTQETV